MRRLKRRTHSAGLAGLVLLTSCGGPRAAPGEGTENGLAMSEASCTVLFGLELVNTTISESYVVPAGFFTPPGSSQALEVPSFCRVVGMTEPAVNFEVWLPMADWNGRFQSVGNGGMAGSISFPAMAVALQRGSVTASTDTGRPVG